MIEMKNEKLKEARNALGLGMWELALEINVSISSITAWEWGKCMPNHTNMQSLCILFGKTPEELGFRKD